MLSYIKYLRMDQICNKSWYLIEDNIFYDFMFEIKDKINLFSDLLDFNTSF
jgi:hypothetical protein